jgi:hypothetical protein
MGSRNLDDDGALMGRLEDGGDEHGQPEPGWRRRARRDARDGLVAL